MPLTWNDPNKEEARNFLRKLLQYANELQYLEKSKQIRDLNCRWNDKDSNGPKLFVETILQQVMVLLGRDKLHPKELNQRKDALSRIINELVELGILTDNRFRKQGSLNWRFTVNLGY